MSGDEPKSGQSEAAKAWKAHRDEVDRAIAASEQRREKERVVEVRHTERQRSKTNPMVFVIAMIVVLGALIALTWLFITRLQCDPMITAMGSSKACRQQQAQGQ